MNESSALARVSSGDRLDAAPDVIGHVQHVAGEVRHRVGPGIGDLPLRPAAQVFHVGHQTQELVPQLVFFRLENRYRIDRGFGGFGRRLLGLRRVLVFRVVRFHRQSAEIEGKGSPPHIRSRDGTNQALRRCGASLSSVLNTSSSARRIAACRPAWVIFVPVRSVT